MIDKINVVVKMSPGKQIQVYAADLSTGSFIPVLCPHRYGTYLLDGVLASYMA